LGFFSWLVGHKNDDPAREERLRDQVERGGTRASSTLQQENKGDTSSRFGWITERGREANPREK
jgi:hypothetical protein